MTSDHQGDIELEFEACRCSLPTAAVAAVRDGFEKCGLRVTSEQAGSGREVLVAARVRRLELKRPLFGGNAESVSGVGRGESVIDLVDDVQVTEAQLAPLLEAVVTAEAVERRRSDLRPTWMPVFDLRTWTRTGIELLVRDDGDADSQLEALAAALELTREHVEVKPPPGWNGYGHPALRRS